MPLTLTVTEGVLPKGAEKNAVKQLTDLMLKHHGLTGNKVMTPNVTATLHILPKTSTFSAGEEFNGVWIEWKVPSFAFATQEINKKYFTEATQVIHDLSQGKQAKENIYINVLHTVDGAWNMNGTAMTNEELGQEISKG